MKKIILTGLSVALGIALFSSFGYNVTTTVGDCTGSNGSTGTCSPSGCHFSSISSDLVLSIIVTDASNGNLVTSYTPNGYYKITLKGTHGAGGVYSGYGLQFTAASANDGQFTLVGNSLKSVVVPPYEYIEQRQPIPAVNNSCQPYFLWQAPPPGAGTLTFYCTMLAVNGDNAINGDVEKNTAISLTETITSVSDLGNAVSMQLYPNPTFGDINLKLDAKELGDYQIAVYDLSGKKISTEEIKVQSGSFTKQLSTTNLPSGMFLIELKKGSGHKVMSFIKQ